MPRSLTLAARTVQTPYGVATYVYGSACLILTATPAEVVRWARRDDSHWPCSVLMAADEAVAAVFDSGGSLVDLCVGDGYPIDVPEPELSAWSTDLIRAAGMAHPAIR